MLDLKTTGNNLVVHPTDTARAAATGKKLKNFLGLAAFEPIFKLSGGNANTYAAALAAW